MKKVIFGIFIIHTAGLLYIIYPIWINPKSPKEIDVYKFQELNIEVSYSRPSKRGRILRTRGVHQYTGHILTRTISMPTSPRAQQVARARAAGRQR